MWPAAAPAAFSPCASVAPEASAAAFFATPASSTPVGSLDSSHTTPALMNTPASAVASDSSVEAATRPAPSLTISRACAGPPTHPCGSVRTPRVRISVGGVPSGATRPLASDTTAALGGKPWASNPAITSASPAAGTPRNT